MPDHASSSWGEASTEGGARQPVKQPADVSDGGDSSSLASPPDMLGLPDRTTIASQRPSPETVLRLQRTLGNHAVQRLILRDTAPSTGSPTTPIGPEGGPLDNGLAGQIDAMRGSGARLPGQVQRNMENLLGEPLGNVNVHADSDSAGLAQSVGARAFTVGNDVFFGEGEYQPGTPPGDKLLSHELTHVVQQQSMGGSGPATVGAADDRFEQEADATAARMLQPAQSRDEADRATDSGGGIQRQLATGVLQRQDGPSPGRTLNPVVLSDDPATQAALQAQSDAMMARFPEVARGFCRDWFAAATAAMATAPEPGDPYAQRNYYVALGGNAAWAATSLSVVVSGISGGGAIAVVITSALGAGAGSGAFSKAAPPSGKAAVTDRLAQMRGEFETRATNREFLIGVAQDAIADDKISTDQQAQDELLWKKFSDDKVPFGSRVEFMTSKLREILADWLQQFQTQYLAWKARDDVIKKAREYELADESSGPYGSPFDIIADMLDVGTPADAYFDPVLADIPLTVTFETH